MTLYPSPTNSLPKARLDQAPYLITSETEALTLAEKFAESIKPTALQRDQERILPWQELEQFSQTGLWGITVPQAYGGLSASAHTLAQVIALIGAADGSLAQIPQNHYYALEVLRVGGSPAQQAFFYELALRGARFGNALAEIGHKDFKRRTTLSREPDGWWVTGTKFYCTGALFAHWIPTLVTTVEPQGENQYLVFIPRDAEGVYVIDDWDGFGQRVTGSGSVQFQRVKIDPLWIIPFKASFETPTTIGPFAQLIHAALDLGIGQGAFKASLDFIQTEARPWIDANVERASDDPILLADLGKVHLRLKAAEILVKRAAQIVDATQLNPTMETVAQASIAVAEAKVLTTTASLLAGTKLLELGGTRATLADYGLDRFWRNARTHTLHDPVRWKYHAIGNYVLNGVHPPRHGAI